MTWSTDVSKKCKQFVQAHWGRDGLQQIMDHPVSWVRYQANPQLKALRRRKKGLPSISITPSENRIELHLSTEKGAQHV